MPLEDERADLDQVLVALHALVVALLWRSSLEMSMPGVPTGLSMFDFITEAKFFKINFMARQPTLMYSSTYSAAAPDLKQWINQSMDQSIKVLHENREFSVSVSKFPLHGLPLQDQRADLDQVLVALHALIVALLPGDVHTRSAHRTVDV